jgi:hypothetical protein
MKDSICFDELGKKIIVSLAVLGVILVGTMAVLSGCSGKEKASNATIVRQAAYEHDYNVGIQPVDGPVLDCNTAGRDIPVVRPVYELTGRDIPVVRPVYDIQPGDIPHITEPIIIPTHWVSGDYHGLPLPQSYDTAPGCLFENACWNGCA